ncbi:hypothetical protein DJ90_5539 [Paenibacillus macerans]|uniref:Uncharacterized protein n=1 Tax=Paenibacillus macerans TaxID=44252 RepID=A0A090YC25_PAEMA|nr:hypothetical protein DJ90_5539 [Paenibacillus macerans]
MSRLRRLTWPKMRTILYGCTASFQAASVSRRFPAFPGEESKNGRFAVKLAYGAKCRKSTKDCVPQSICGR